MLHRLIELRLQAAVAAVLPDVDPALVLVRPCPDARHGDYQSTVLIGLAKARQRNPRELAQQVQGVLDVAEWCQPVEIAGPGFLNFRLRPEAIDTVLRQAFRGEHGFFQKAAQPRTVVVDFSSPNVAKPMHVGHIRSTILGDCLARTLRLLGHRVITDNHLGDWGTQFGMLLVGWKTGLDRGALQADPLAEMERIYKLVSAQCDPEKPEFRAEILDRARSELVKLQAGDVENLGIWREMIRLSAAQFEVIYGRLDIHFDHTLGESHYNPTLPAVVQSLVEAGIATESRGALAVFSDGKLPPKEDPFLIQRDGEWGANPFIVRKQDGGFNYATTDLATLEFRWREWRADEVVYVTDGRQQLHFRQLFAAFGRWHPDARIKAAHVWFGSILGPDGKPFKTRSGETVRLAELLDEAEERALAVVTTKNPELGDADRRAIARVVGIGALKYADLLPNRQSDYVFDWDKLLALNGNTAPYLQYAWTRIRSIFGKLGANGCSPESWRDVAREQIAVRAPEEEKLAKHLLRFGIVLEAVAEEYRPNYLCNYLFDLAGHFTLFYERCPVLRSEDPVRASRLALCELTAAVLQQGLAILGIETSERM